MTINKEPLPEVSEAKGAYPLPRLSVMVSDFIRDIEQRLKADEDKYMCCVCFEPFANASLKCSHKLCPDCFEKLDACPMCRVKFKEDSCVYSNFDACIWRIAACPVTYDVCVHGGKTRHATILTKRLIDTLIDNIITFELGILETNDSTVFRHVSDMQICVDTIRRHTEVMNLISKNNIRRALVDEGLLDNIESFIVM
jgi:hypothetical protein